MNLLNVAAVKAKNRSDVLPIAFANDMLGKLWRFKLKPSFADLASFCSLCDKVEDLLTTCEGTN